MPYMKTPVSKTSLMIQAMLLVPCYWVLRRKFVEMLVMLILWGCIHLQRSAKLIARCT